MKSAAGEKLQFSESQKEKGTSCRKDQMKLPWCMALQAQHTAWHSATLTGTQTPRMCLSLSVRTITAFLLANKLCWTVVNTPRPLKQQMHLIWLDLPAVTHTHAVHTRFVRTGQEGQALKYHSTTLSSENNCKKPGFESRRKTRNQKAERKQWLIKNRALQILKFKPWKRSRSYPSPSLYPFSHCSTEHL